jgi:hypothetical protein
MFGTLKLNGTVQEVHKPKGGYMTVKNLQVSYPPSVVPPSPNEFPVTTFPITNITVANPATVTCPNHPFSQSADATITTVDFLQVRGMQQINSKNAFILNVIDANNFTVGLDTLQMYAYTGGGIISIVGGHAPYSPFQNILQRAPPAP